MSTPLLFVNGFHRSGTTLTTSAVTEATGGVTTTVGVLARHIPSVATFLADHADTPVDRGADRLELTPATAEEYGFLLHHHTGDHALYRTPEGVARLREHVAELAAEAGDAPVVLKNPYDTGQEARLLADFPDARIILLRRRVADIERSIAGALRRSHESDYLRALDGDSAGYQQLQDRLASPRRQAALIAVLRLGLRRRALGLARSVKALPADRIAVVSYEELRADPHAGAAWAAHLLDPERLAEAFARHAFPETGPAVQSKAMQRAVDARWRRAWQQVRETQVQTGVLSGRAPVAAA